MARLDPSAPWNRPYRKQCVCVPIAAGVDSDPPVRYPDGTPVGRGYVMPRAPEWNLRSTEHDLCTGMPGFVRIDRTEVVPGSPDLFFHKGGQGYDPPSGAAYGHVTADVLDAPPEPAFSKERIDRLGAHPGRNRLPGAGRAHPREIATYLVRPGPIRSDDEPTWLYKPRRAGARYSKYGDAGPSMGARNAHFAYLCWSWLRQHGVAGSTVPGGGAVRALLGDGQIVHRCGVEAVITPAWNLAGTLVGRVRAIYVRVPVGPDDLYGWIVHSHLIPDGDGEIEVPHVERVDR